MTFSFGGQDLAPYLFPSSVNRSIAPARRLGRTEVPGMDGELVTLDGLEAVELTVRCHLTPRGLDDVSVVRRLLAKMLQGGERALRLPDEPGRYVMACYEGGAELSRLSRRPGVDLAFLCADPVAYGQGRSASLTAAAKLVDSGGTYKAWPTVTAKPPRGSYWTLTNATTGEFVRVDAAFTGSQTVVLDMARQRCTVNGADHAVSISSDYFALDGEQRLMVSSGTATMEWEERWL